MKVPHTAKITWFYHIPKLALALGLAVGAFGCSILIGNVKPVEERSQSYTPHYNSSKSAHWVTVSSLEGRKPSADQPDYLIRRKGNMSTIATASRCRGSSIDQGWFGWDALGLEDVESTGKRARKVGAVDATESDAVGRLDEVQLKLRLVEVELKGCEYRFLFFSESDSFERDSQEFEAFLKSVQFK
jgi:hypothetical protein